MRGAEDKKWIKTGRERGGEYRDRIVNEGSEEEVEGGRGREGERGEGRDG